MSEVLELVDSTNVVTDGGNSVQKTELEKLRNKNREEKLAYRERQREYFLKRARFLGEEDTLKNVPEDNIILLAKSLKNKSQISCELLKALMNTLLDNKENITEFLKIDGALQALLRVLSGQNEKYQLIAAQCICNLALGNEKQSFQVLKASEPYLMMHLSGRNSYVKEACVMALGNFSRQGLKHIELLMNQGFFNTILHLLKECDENFESSAIYALTQFIYYGHHFLRMEDLDNCLSVILPIFKSRSFSVAFLLSVLSSCENCKFNDHFLKNEIHIQALRYLLISLRDGDKESLYYFRILHNSMSEGTGQMGIDLIEKFGIAVRKCIRQLLESKEGYLKKECLSLVGNLLNHPVEGLKQFGEGLVLENAGLIQLYMWDCAAGSTVSS